MSDAPRDILDALAQDARVLRRARMLPTDRPLNHAEITQVAKDVQQWLDESRRTLRSVSKALGEGYSTTTISAFLGSSYKGDCEKVARALNTYMEQQTQQAEVRRPEGFIQYAVAKKMLATIVVACDDPEGGIALITCPAGVGKTIVSKAAHKMRPGSIWHGVIETERSCGGFVRQLASILGIATHRSVPMILRAIIERLKGSGRLLIIDEAHLLDERTLTVVRGIRDQAAIPIALFCTDEILDLVNDTRSNLGQFASRVSARYDANADLEEQRTRPRGRKEPCLFSVGEIEATFSKYHLRLTDGAVEMLYVVANAVGFGCLRLVNTLVRFAARVPETASKGEIDRPVLMAVLRQRYGDTYVEQIAERARQLGLPSLVAVA